MAFRLEDLCLRVISRNIHVLPSRWGSKLTRLQKETLLERMASHELFTPERLPLVTYHLFSSQLNRLELANCKQVDDKFLKQLSRCGCRLTSFTIESCPNVGDPGLSALFESQPILEEVTLHRPEIEVTSRSLAKILCSDTLKTFVLFRSQGITSKGIIQLVQNNTNIHTLNLSFLPNVATEAIEAVALYLGESLAVLFIENVHTIETAAIHALAEHCPHLEELYCDGCNRLTGAGIHEVVARCKLHTLDNSLCYGLAADSMGSIAELQNAISRLKRVHFPAHLDGRLAVMFAQKLECLTELYLCGQALTDRTVADVCEAAGNRLQALGLDGGLQLTEDACRSISQHCVSLTVLRMPLCVLITGVGLLRLFENAARASRLKELYFNGCKKIQWEVVGAIAENCRELVELTLAGVIAVNNHIVNCLASNCSKLTVLNIKGCNQVTDTAICNLACACPISCIVLSGIHSLTDKSMIFLAEHCPGLEDIYVTACHRISKAAIAYAQDSSLVRATVHHRVPNAPADKLMAKNLDTGEYLQSTGQPEEI